MSGPTTDQREGGGFWSRFCQRRSALRARLSAAKGGGSGSGRGGDSEEVSNNNEFLSPWNPEDGASFNPAQFKDSGPQSIDVPESITAALPEGMDTSNYSPSPVTDYQIGELLRPNRPADLTRERRVVPRSFGAVPELDSQTVEAIIGERPSVDVSNQRKRIDGELQNIIDNVPRDDEGQQIVDVAKKAQKNVRQPARQIDTTGLRNNISEIKDSDSVYNGEREMFQQTNPGGVPSSIYEVPTKIGEIDTKVDTNELERRSYRNRRRELVGGLSEIATPPALPDLQSSDVTSPEVQPDVETPTVRPAIEAPEISEEIEQPEIGELSPYNVERALEVGGSDGVDDRTRESRERSLRSSSIPYDVVDSISESVQYVESSQEDTTRMNRPSGVASPDIAGVLEDVRKNTKQTAESFEGDSSPSKVRGNLRDFDVEEIGGIGESTAKDFEASDIYSGYDLSQRSDDDLKKIGGVGPSTVGSIRQQIPYDPDFGVGGGGGSGGSGGSGGGGSNGGRDDPGNPLRNIMGRIAGFRPSMKMYSNLIATFIPLLITMTGAALGAAAALGALGAAGAAIVGFGLMGFENPTRRIKALKQQLKGVFKPVSESFQPIVGRFMRMAPVLSQDLVQPLQGLSAYEDTFAKIFRGAVSWVADVISVIVALEEQISGISLNLAQAFGKAAIKLFISVINELTQNWKTFAKVAQMFGMAILIVYKLAKALTFVVTVFSPLLRILLALTKILNNRWVLALLQVITVFGILIGIILAVQTGLASLAALTLVSWANMIVGAVSTAITALSALYASILGVSTALATLLSIATLGLGAIAIGGIIASQSGSLAGGMPSPSGGGFGGGFGGDGFSSGGTSRGGNTINLYGSIRDRDMQKLRDKFPGQYRESSDVEEETTKPK